MPIDHVILNVRDYARSKAFYEQALKPLGYEVVMEFGEGAGFGLEGKPDFWVSHRGDPTIVHVAFAAPDRRTVDAFYDAALAAGGEDNGPPGLRPHYHETYYAAFVHDPDGNNIEAVCHRPE
ncbi:MAG TPA: VOC family protein [Gaiellaceae bacterium]|nr:VOC family protein [Gaiellaceae bacterium]